VTLERPPGTYAVAVTRDGYVRVQQNIEVRAGQVVVLPITLAPAAETGVEIAGDPPGVPVWLDGVRLAGTGQPSRTGARTYPVQAGKHLLELRGDPKFKPWRESFEIEKGSVRSFHVQLAPVESAEPSHRISTGVVTAPSRWRTAHAALKIENSDETVALMANANPATAAPPGATGTATRPPLPTPLPAAGTEDEPRPDDVPASAEADPAPPPGGAAPRTVPDRLARAQLLIDPNAEEYRVTLPPPLAQAGKKLTAVVRVCVSALGAVSEVQILKSADAAVDPDIRTVIGKWRYQPLMIDGRAAPFCTVLNHDVSPP
jgi:outer membrane biosynthesis protein TonB